MPEEKEFTVNGVTFIMSPVENSVIPTYHSHGIGLRLAL